ncbi:hypothetical protein [Marinobacter zhejiangensis]|uniref:Uncharacterized protein n=1 Tax=Marinobacter zhejiangensis TaxID=488535 RepID=A0A1I4Q4G7_9GAMM|nr:hypothetical protein [Marinobacter zhejiangensis]SFM34969.1 hypothetical protein SAMN04487963_2177 [Marinobacter zhejiangensis]
METVYREIDPNSKVVAINERNGYPSEQEQQLRKQLRRLMLERDLAIVEKERAVSELVALKSLIGSLRARVSLTSS